jgi:WhiB family redox-sensing transcriptional regulator
MTFDQRRRAWVGEAACRGDDPADWHTDITAEHIATCTSCPVAEQCLEYAIDDDTLLGIHAGTTANDRRVIRQMRGMTKRVECAPWKHKAAGEPQGEAGKATRRARDNEYRRNQRRQNRETT